MELTLKELTDVLSTRSKGSYSFFEVGKCYFIRTVTMHFTGRLVDISDTELLLEHAAWIADSGRFSNCLHDGEFSEVEPYPDRVIVSRSALIDASEWNHPLPREQK